MPGSRAAAEACIDRRSGSSSGLRRAWGPRLLQSSSQGQFAAEDRNDRGWWNRPAYLVLLALLFAIPLLYPAIPPLGDLPGHLGRYRVELGIGDSPWLGRWFDYRWRPIGNLGVDLLILPLAPLIGLEPAVKLIILCIPPLTGLGFLLAAREAHGRVPPTAAFALPLAMGYPFHFGFVNFALSMALAYPAFGLWLRLGRLGRTRLRDYIFVVFSCVIWFAHAFGWAVLCLLCFSAEFAGRRERGVGWIDGWIAAARACLPLTPPILLMLLWHEDSASAQTTTFFFHWKAKIGWLQSVLRDRWVRLDGDMALVLAGLVGLGFIRVLRFERRLLAAAGV